MSMYTHLQSFDALINVEDEWPSLEAPTWDIGDRPKLLRHADCSKSHKTCFGDAHFAVRVRVTELVEPVLVL